MRGFWNSALRCPDGHSAFGPSLLELSGKGGLPPPSPAAIPPRVFSTRKKPEESRYDFLVLFGRSDG